MVNRVGLQLGNYRLIHLIGFGPHTEVYLGEHIYLRTQAAIKVLQIQLMGNALEDFLTGARAIGGLMHPNIVRVLDFGVENNVPFLVLDYAPNGTLRQQHPYGTRLSLETILSYVGQIAPTLQYAHDRQLFHCDIRPENMLLGSNYEIMLSDFSMALITRSLLQQRVKSVVSAIAYMAPEQIEGKPCAASDQYALGSVVYEWLSGSLPSRPLASLQKVAAVSRDVEQVVLKALARDPGRRFANVVAFALALQQASGIGKNFVVTPHANSFALSSPERTLLTSATSQSSVHSSFSMDRAKRRPTRRVILFGLIGLAAGAAVTGSLTWLALPRLLQPGSNSSSHPTVPPVGTTLYTYRGHSDFVNAVAWSLDGTLMASASDDDTVQVWHAATGRHVYTYQAYPAEMKAVAWSPVPRADLPGGSSSSPYYLSPRSGGLRIASGGSAEDTVQIWDAGSGSNIITCKGHTSFITTIAWSPDGKFIASGSNDQSVRVWRPDTGDLVYMYTGHTDAVSALCWSVDGQRIASASHDQTVQVWDATTGSHRYIYHGHAKPVNTLGWSPDGPSSSPGRGSRIASGDMGGVVQVWDATSGGNVFSYYGHFFGVNALAWSPNGTRIASGDITGKVQVWDATSGGNAFTYGGHRGRVKTVAWSPDGKQIASGGNDKTVQIWQAG